MTESNKDDNDNTNPNIERKKKKKTLGLDSKSTVLASIKDLDLDELADVIEKKHKIASKLSAQNKASITSKSPKQVEGNKTSEDNIKDSLSDAERKRRAQILAEGRRDEEDHREVITQTDLEVTDYKSKFANNHLEENEENDTQSKVTQDSSTQSNDTETYVGISTVELVVRESAIKNSIKDNAEQSNNQNTTDIITAQTNKKDKIAKDEKLVKEDDNFRNKKTTHVDSKRIAKAKKILLDELLQQDDENDYDVHEDELADDDVNSHNIQQEENKSPDKPIRTFRVNRKNKSKTIKRQKIQRTLNLHQPVSVKYLASLLTEKLNSLLKTLRDLQVDANEESILDLDTAQLVANSLGHHINVIVKDNIMNQYLYPQDQPEELTSRPPVVAVMGHVDHGKTTLLDTIKKTKITELESGGITQHIGASQVVLPNNSVITFLDTPGHEAFTKIRSRGAEVTDIIILVVAADDGLMPQTIESINHALAHNVQIIVAINKIDKTNTNIPKIKNELLQHNITLEEYGGDVLSVEISALNNIGIADLLETITLQAEILELKTNHQAPGLGNIIEVKQAKGIGFIATVLIDRGTIKVGDYFVCNNAVGKVRSLTTFLGEKIKVAPPSMPVEVTGFNSEVNAGDRFIVVPSEAEGERFIKEQTNQQAIEGLTKQDLTINKIDINELLSQSLIDKKELCVIIKADTQGVIEAIKYAIGNIHHQELSIKILHATIGEITEADVNLASIGNSVIIGFNTRAAGKIKKLAEEHNIPIRYHSIIYNAIDDLKTMLSGLLNPNLVENILGYAEVKEVFSIKKIGTIAGCLVTDGLIKRHAKVRLLRNNIVIYEGDLDQLKRFKNDVKEVKQGFECGLLLTNNNDIQISDIVECYELNEVRGKIE